MHLRSNPRQEYEGRKRARESTLANLERRDELLVHARTAVFLAGLGTLVAVVTVDAIRGWWLLLPPAVFLVLAVIHSAAARANRRAEHAVAYYTNALARLDGSWPGTGVQRADLAAEDHPCAVDLDLFGSGSLFELLCTARTAAGEETLAGWLLRGATPDEVRARQRAVEALRGRIDLREDLALLGGTVRSSVHPAVLTRWGEAAPIFAATTPWGVIRLLAWLLSAASVATGVLWAATDLGVLPFIAAVFMGAVFTRILRRQVARVLEAVQQPREELNVLATVLERLERETFADPWLEARQRDLRAGDLAASIHVRRLERLVTWLDSQRNQMFFPIAFVLLWSVHFAFAIESWRRRAGGEIARWLGALGELEALVALASYAHDNPEDPFPAILDEPGPLFDGEALGHPLLPRKESIPNSICLGEGTRVMVVSGSNMSGKSTLLRTVGTNVVLALAGAPVRASRLRLSALRVGATLRIQDSLSDGRSRFYVEISRLRQLMDLSGDRPPLLFLLDEILHGTNSHDRRIGAEAVVRGLIDGGAVGLVTTHDLALAEAAEALAPRGRNVHFQDELVAGRLRFDYRLRSGVVERSNALELMRSVGLRV